MGTTVSLSQIGLYNPQRQTTELTERLFVVRQKQFESLMENLNDETPDSIPQHHLILAQRGMGKTTMLKRIEVELHKEQYRQKFIPVLFPEEQYGLSNLTKFWLNCLDAVADALDIEKYNKDEINNIDEHIKELMHVKKTNDLNEKLYRYLMFICKQLGRRPVLLIDNIGLVFNRLSKQEQHVLRGYISEKSCPIFISAGVAMAGYSDTKEHVIDYKAPFYDFFQIHYLKKMSMEEFLVLIQNLANVTQTNISITSKELPRLQSLLQLTGGNPRTSVMLFKLLVKGFSAEIVDDLEALLDEITPLYKARFEELPAQQQIILDAIAQNWNPMSLKRIAEETRFENNQLSPQLKRLIEEGWLETTKAENAKGNAYSIPERFFSIYHIMRNGSRRSKKQIIYLSRFLECFYGKKHLSEAARYILDKNFFEEKQRILALALLETKIQKHEKVKLKNKIFSTIKDLSRNDAGFLQENSYVMDVYKEKMYEKFLESLKCNNYTDTKAIIAELKSICSKAEISAIQEIVAKTYEKFDEEAEKALKHAIKLDEKNFQARFDLGVLYLDMNNYSEAENMLRTATSIDEDNEMALILLSLSLDMQNKYADAESIHRKIVSLNENDADNWILLGANKFAQDKNIEAKQAFHKAIALDPDNAMAYRFLGDIYGDIDYKKAIEYYDKSIDLNPNNATVYKQRGYTYSEMNETENAIADYTKAIELNPVYAFAYNDRGWEYAYGIKDYDKAIADYTKAIEFDEKCNANKHLLHLYRDIKNQFDKAEEVFNIIDFPENVKWLEKTLFELHKRNEGTAGEHLLRALHFVENGLTKNTQSGWEYFAAITIKLGYGQWLLDILKEKELDIILSPYYVAIQALEIEKTKNAETAEIYLKNQAIEKSGPARIIIEKVTRYL